jgi:ubiquinone/menaquinone biosynthesis C-methylase UbiE
MKDNIKDLNKMAVNTYDIIAEDYNKVFGNDMSDKEYIDKFLREVNKGRILDVGCGVGNLTKYIKDKGFEVLGIDLSNNMLKIAKERFPDVEFKLMDMTDIKLPKNSFDALFVAYSLFHLPPNKIENTAKGFVELLNSKGKIMFILQEGNGDVIVDEPFKPSEKMYINYFTRDTIVGLLKKLNFKILHFDTRGAKSSMELGNNKLFVIAELNN